MAVRGLIIALLGVFRYISAFRKLRALWLPSLLQPQLCSFAFSSRYTCHALTIEITIAAMV